MTGKSGDARERLETIKEELENLSLQQQATDPKRHQIVHELIGQAAAAIESVGREQARRKGRGDRGETSKVPPALLREGEYLWAQLLGVEGTEGREPGFANAREAERTGGFEALSAAVWAAASNAAKGL